MLSAYNYFFGPQKDPCGNVEEPRMTFKGEGTLLVNNTKTTERTTQKQKHGKFSEWVGL